MSDWFLLVPFVALVLGVVRLFLTVHQDRPLGPSDSKAAYSFYRAFVAELVRDRAEDLLTQSYPEFEKTWKGLDPEFRIHLAKYYREGLSQATEEGKRSVVAAIERCTNGGR